DCVYMPKANISVSPAISKHVLAVVHADTRGTKKAVDDALYRAGVSNLQSAHVDFPRFGIAYDLSAIDQPLNTEQLDSLVEDAIQLTGAQDAIRSIRMITRA
ncbi:MAG: 3-phosphoglycerate dehydrogenase, partial [Deltaproteobacteria bacterium CG17_big_fil_post_rev_8_21_14_2_50_63_7]